MVTVTRRSTSPPGPRPQSSTASHDLARSLGQAARALQEEHDPLRIVRVIADHVERVVPNDDFTIYEADVAAHRFRPLIATGPESAKVLDYSFPLDEGLTGWAFAKGRPIRVGDAAAHPRSSQVPGTALVEESALLIPLIAGERKLGMLTCYRRGLDRFDDLDVEVAALFGHMAAAAWRNAQLYAELLDAAMTDPLTGLFNNRWLREAGERELHQSARAQKSLAVLVLDLDHFKTVNDSSGHAAGDQMLQAVARILQSSVRRGDAAVRFGGEEFLLLLRDTDAEGALHVADAVRSSLRTIRLPDNCALARVTASVGIAVFPDHGNDLDALIRYADAAMYDAKRTGRDRTYLAPPLGGVSALPPSRAWPDRPQRGPGEHLSSAV